MIISFQVLCSTMHGKKPLFYDKGFLPNKFLIVNQIISKNENSPDFLNFYEKGLSKSRNRAIENSNADICLIADNDVYFNDDLLKTIENYFKYYKDADILTFKIETPEGEPFKKYKGNFFWHNKLSLAKVSSVEIAFRLKSIQDAKLKFDENFGLGTKFSTGEEYIFLSDALKAGLKIGFIPEVIAYHPKESSGGDFSNLSLVEAKGAMIYRVFGAYGLFFCFLFCLKKFKHSKWGFFRFLHIMVLGFFKSKKL